jgi:ESCRT-II complex subunit VPS36
MLFKPLDLTTALRPLLFPDESLLFVQDAVGLYEGYMICPSARTICLFKSSSHVLYTTMC